jgi:hypothetical protein
VRAELVGAWLACSAGVMLVAHVALLVGLARRKPWWRAVAALVVPPLAPMWGWTEMPRRAQAWAAAGAAYAVVVAIVR